MSKSPEAKARQAARIQRKYRREKTAAYLMPHFLGRIIGDPDADGVYEAAQRAVEAADMLLKWLDDTDKRFEQTKEKCDGDQ